MVRELPSHYFCHYLLHQSLRQSHCIHLYIHFRFLHWFEIEFPIRVLVVGLLEPVEIYSRHLQPHFLCPDGKGFHNHNTLLVSSIIFVSCSISSDQTNISNSYGQNIFETSHHTNNVSRSLEQILMQPNLNHE